MLGFEAVSDLAISEHEIFDIFAVRPFCLEVSATCLFDADISADCGLDLEIDAECLFDPAIDATTGGA